MLSFFNLLSYRNAPLIRREEMLRSWQVPQSPILVFRDIDFYFLEHRGCTHHAAQSIRSFSSVAGGLYFSRARLLTPPCLFPQIPQLLPLWLSLRAAPDFPSRGDKVVLKDLVAWGFDCLGMWLIVKVNKIFDTALPAVLRSCSLHWMERAQSTEI